MNSRIVRLAWVLVLSFAFAGCSDSSNSSSHTVLVADADHQIVVGQPQEPKYYEIDPASGVQVDISQIQFTIGGASVKPDTVYIFNGSKKLYHLAQPISGNVVVLDASTLNAVKGPLFEAGPAFKGFQSGHHLMLHVGRENPGNPNYETMSAEWVAMIMVK
jgi:hypothetical protein